METCKTCNGKRIVPALVYPGGYSHGIKACPDCQCPVCDGTGQVVKGHGACPDCNGTGHTDTPADIDWLKVERSGGGEDNPIDFPDRSESHKETQRADFDQCISDEGRHGADYYGQRYGD